MKLFEYFTRGGRSGISNLILHEIRQGFFDTEMITENIKTKMNERLKWDDDEKIYTILNAIKDTKAMQEAVAHYIDWEKKSHQEKEKIKQSNSQKYIEEDMKTKPPTEKQIVFLSKNGINNFEGNRYEASKIINKIINNSKL